jgi:hypothetical protein
MPRQNRVDPFGTLFATTARGQLTGNRGCLHNRQRVLTRRRWTTRAWIACRLEFKGRHRVIMTPGRWTELFFLDEATAFAAGHRPCGECRRQDYVRFKRLWCAANGGDAAAPIRLVDDRLHAERIARPRTTWRSALDGLPDGTMWLDGDDVWLVAGDRIGRWTPSGYRDVRPRPSGTEVSVLTPASLVSSFSAGYRPSIHSTLAARHQASS